MAQINIMQSNCNKENLNASHTKDQSPEDMVVPEINDGNFEEFDIEFK